ncbi:MAG: branched-chain amino acid ABC transporter permease [Desulfarculus sp.]|nr:branched-chain amino acid ABC transporter permease [Pseudomonadota bacterium]MBU4597140.1 branched-chain amino acid ABC transporter permease [Pseudomonadota bacterium]MBV1714369.1 branched-chain amino acid ABC transporter permease [Desulfarculus sp.]MBV1738225.1 branched-chain amino acid ABC transporter permease [Desulfarculus sp.]
MDYSTLAVQLFLTGIFLSSLYILVTFGLTMIFGVMEIVNFAHASFAILGGYACLLAVTSMGMDPFVALVPVVAFMALIGWLTFEFFARYTLDVGDAHVVHYYALLLIISNILALIFGLDYKFVPSGLGYSQIEIGPFKYPLLKFIVAIISLATVAGLSLYLKKSVIGKKIRAVSQSKESAEIMGIDSLKIRRITWIIGVSSAGLMGALVGLVNPFSPYAGTTYLIVAFSVAILGGMGSLFGTIVAGFIIGMTESLFSLFLPSQISPVVAFVFIIGVLMVKPEGLFSRA